MTSKGNSIIYVVKNKVIIALIGVNDIVRGNTKATIEELNKKNIKTIMLTGDNKETAENIGEKIGITEIIPNVLPKEKAEIHNIVLNLTVNRNKIIKFYNCLYKSIE